MRLGLYLCAFSVFGIAVFAASPARIGVTVAGGRPVTYEVHGDYAVIEGDIIVATVDEVDNLAATGRILQPKSVASNAVMSGKTKWPDGTIPYEIDPNLPKPERVTEAVEHWNTHTPLRLVPHSGEPNYVFFTPGHFDAACNSFVGMQGGKQNINITDSCTAGALIHEIGHAFGLYHEQTRSDRNAYITVLYGNIDKRYRSQFDQARTSATDGGYYDYDSIMQYGSTAFTRNNLDTMETVPVGIPIGQLTALSPGDIDNVVRLYGITPSTTTITTVPARLEIIVDGVSTTAPQSYSWAAGSVHSISVNPQHGTDPRYVLARWSDGGAASHSITASPATTVYCAEFVRQHAASAGVAGAAGTAAISPAAADGYYPDRMEVLLDAAPGSGAEFVRWQGLTNLQANGFGVSSLPAVVDISVTGARYVAQFSTQPVTTIDSKPRGRAVNVDGTKYLTPARFVWTAGSTHKLAVTGPQMSGNNTVRYNFKAWEDGSPDTTRTLTAGSNSTTYNAEFATQYLLSTSVGGSGRVVVSPTSDDGFYDAGTTVQLTAEPAPAAAFRSWLGDPVSGSPTQSLVMTEDRFAAAIFGAAMPFRVLNSASNTGNPVFDNSGALIAPGELLTLYGANIGPGNAASGSISDGVVSSSAAGTRVLFDGRPAPVLYASANQINVVAPSTIGAKPTTVVQVETAGKITSLQTIATTDTAPGLFTADGSGTGQIAALNQDGSVNSPITPARPGSVMVLYGTGAGILSQSLRDGQIAGNSLIAPEAPVYVRIGKLPARVLYAGTAPGLVNGVFQVNVEVPKELIPGPAVPIQVIAGAYASPVGTSIAVQ